MKKSFTDSDNAALARAIAPTQLSGPKLRVQWLASGADNNPPGTWFKAETQPGHVRRVFHVFTPAPGNSRLKVKAALMNHLQGLTLPHPAIKVQEITQ